MDYQLLNLKLSTWLKLGDELLSLTISLTISFWRTQSTWKLLKLGKLSNKLKHANAFSILTRKNFSSHDKLSKMPDAFQSFSSLDSDSSDVNLRQKTIQTFSFSFKMAVLGFSVIFFYTKMPASELKEISEGFVKKMLLFTLITTVFTINFQTFAFASYQEVFEKSLKKFDKVFGSNASEDSKKSCFKKLSLAYFENFLFLSVCSTLSIVPLLCDKEYGIWEVLLYSIFLINFATFRYAMKIGQIRLKIEKIKEIIEEIQNEHESLQNLNTAKNGDKIFVESFKTKLEDEKKVIKMIKCHNVISVMVNAFNQRHGYSILLIIFSSFLTITYCGYNFFIEIETERNQNIIVGKFKEFWNVTSSKKFFFSFSENLCLFLSFVVLLLMIATSSQRCLNEVDKLNQFPLIKRHKNFSRQIIWVRFCIQLTVLTRMRLWRSFQCSWFSKK